MEFKIGKGNEKNNTTEVHLGLLSAKLLANQRGRSLAQIAEQLAKQFNITDGTIDLVSIEFSYLRHKPREV